MSVCLSVYLSYCLSIYLSVCQSIYLFICLSVYLSIYLIYLISQDNHKNSMAGQTIVINVERGDEIVVYAYTGTWLADFPMNHYTHWVGLLLKPNDNEAQLLRKQIEEGVSEPEPVMNGH